MDNPVSELHKQRMHYDADIVIIGGGLNGGVLH